MVLIPLANSWHDVAQQQLHLSLSLPAAVETEGGEPPPPAAPTAEAPLLPAARDKVAARLFIASKCFCFHLLSLTTGSGFAVESIAAATAAAEEGGREGEREREEGGE